MDEILHRFSYVSHPFQTLNLNIGLLTTLRRGMCDDDMFCRVGGHAGFCPSTVPVVLSF